jgi:hypothetical protein
MLPAYNPFEHLPPPVALLPSLRVNARGRVYLSQELVSRLNLRAGQPGNLLPPSNGSPYWHLDLRPEARHRIGWYADTRPRIEFVKLPPGLITEGQLLTLQLIPGEPTFPGFYPLLPHAAPTQR